MKSKKIFKAEKNKEYVTILNKVFHDERISWGAKGILGYALTKPEDFNLYISEVVKHGSDGKSKVAGYFKELRQAGYFKFQRIYSEGKIIHTEYTVYEIPEHNEPIKASNYSTDNLKQFRKEVNLKSENLIQEKLKIEKLNQENQSPIIKDSLQIKETEKKKEEEKKNTSTTSSSFANRMLEMKNVVSEPVLNRNEAFQRIVNTISRIKKREKGALAGYDSMNKNETANIYALVDQYEGNENIIAQILETMLEYQKSGKLKLYSELLRKNSKHTNPSFWNQATISAFYVLKFASDKEIIDTAIRENEIYEEHQKRKKENATFAKSPETKISIPIDPEFAKQLKGLKDKPVKAVDELEIKRKSDLQKLEAVIAAAPKKSAIEIDEEQEQRRQEILSKLKKVV